MFTDRGAVIEYVNPAFEQLTGYASSEIAGLTPRVLKSGHHSPDFYARFWSTLSQGQPWRGRLTDRRKDGRLIGLETTVTPILS